MTEQTYIIAGLGNPGTKYAGTRHNIGYMVVDELAGKVNVSLDLEKWESFYARGLILDRKVCLLKPSTYMNCSGRAIAKFVDFYKTPLPRLLVIHDDLDMKLGRIKLTAGGGAGGHKGIRSIIQHLGSRNFYRLKIGIGRPGQDSSHPDIAVEDYVLAHFSAEEKKVIHDRMDSLIQGIEFFLHDDISKAMNFLNSFK
jgi:peptidyl-tRNA hydrolase, PTH1 family